MKARLLYECHANWQYITGVHASDPVLWYQDEQGKTHIPVPDLDMTKYLSEKAADHLYLQTELRDRILATGKQPTLAEMALYLVSQGQTRPEIIEVPADFPLSLADKLRAAGLTLTPAEGGQPFFPERYIKSLSEIEKLAEAQHVNEQALHHAVKFLKEADIATDGTLFHNGKTLTAEFLKAEINKKAMELGGCTEFGDGPIVGCGVQGAGPHERGSGPLKANELIVIDTFPRHASGYWGDLTRTFLKGKASAWQTEVYNLVLQAQLLGLSLVRQGADGKAIDAEIVSFFNKNGHPRGTDKQGNPYGYIHSLGHSVGLELHDPGAGLSRAGKPLVAGSVLSVEPGLYYPTNVNGGVGGVRIEDVVTVTASGHTNLTTFPKDKWIID